MSRACQDSSLRVPLGYLTTLDSSIGLHTHVIRSALCSDRHITCDLYIHYPHVGLEHSHDRPSASRTSHTSAPLEHRRAQVCNNTRHHPNKHDQLCTSTVTPPYASYPLPRTTVHPSYRLRCLRARSNPELLGFHQLHNRSHPQPARWDR